MDRASPSPQKCPLDADSRERCVSYLCGSPLATRGIPSCFLFLPIRRHLARREHALLSSMSPQMHKVLGFEARHVLPLAEVVSITLLGTALDLSSSLVITTNSGGVPGELMFIFPGQKRRQVEPLEVLLRQLAVIAAKERAATVEATAAASPVVSS